MKRLQGGEINIRGGPTREILEKTRGKRGRNHDAQKTTKVQSRCEKKSCTRARQGQVTEPCLGAQRQGGKKEEMLVAKGNEATPEKANAIVNDGLVAENWQEKGRRMG